MKRPLGAASTWTHALLTYQTHMNQLTEVQPGMFLSWEVSLADEYSHEKFQSIILSVPWSTWRATMAAATAVLRSGQDSSKGMSVLSCHSFQSVTLILSYIYNVCGPFWGRQGYTGLAKLWNWTVNSKTAVQEMRKRLHWFIRIIILMFADDIAWFTDSEADLRAAISKFAAGQDVHLMGLRNGPLYLYITKVMYMCVSVNAANAMQNATWHIFGGEISHFEQFRYLGSLSSHCQNVFMQAEVSHMHRLSQQSLCHTISLAGLGTRMSIWIGLIF